MTLVAKIVLTEGDLKVTVIGEKPVKGKFKEVMEVSYVGHPTYTVDLHGEGLGAIRNRPALRRALGVICSDMLEGQHTPNAIYRNTWMLLLKQTTEKDNIPIVQKQVDEYLDSLKYDYSKNPHFKIKATSAEISLYAPQTGDDYFDLKFKILRPSKYTITCAIGSRRGGTVRHVSYTRSFGIDNAAYLLKQSIEWIEIFDANIRPPVHRTANMKAGVKSRFESITPLIENLLRNLNEGNNI